MTDTITVTILANGSIKTETDKVSAANHLNAENFLKEVFRMAGGKATITHKHGLPLHEHAHGEGHHHHH